MSFFVVFVIPEVYSFVMRNAMFLFFSCAKGDADYLICVTIYVYYIGIFRALPCLIIMIRIIIEEILITKAC